jgi:colanic acid/amylovoran biosynthesis glycosyltransferase
MGAKPERHMKIAYLLNTYPVPSATFIRREIEALEERGHDILRFAIRRFAGNLVDEKDIVEADRTTYLLQDNIADLVLSLARETLTNLPGLVKTLPLWAKLWRTSDGGLARHIAYLMQAASFRQKTGKAGISHVHTHFGTNTASVAMLAHRLGGVNYSFTAHGPDEFVDASRMSFDLKIANAAFVVAISDYCRDMLISLSGSQEMASKIHVVRCGLPLDDFGASKPILPENTTIVCVGRLCPQKGQIHIPAAVTDLRGDVPDIKVILVGGGESQQDIDAEIRKLGAEHNVQLYGWASNPEVRRLITDARALLLPSYAEGLPIVLMEALALGRPVITTAIAGIPELVDESCGWLIEPGNHDQLVQALLEACTATPEVLNRMGETGRTKVRQLHDVKQLAIRLEALMETKGVASHPARPVESN